MVRTGAILETIIITEKPNAAGKIAEAISETVPKKRTKRNAYWYEIKIDGEHAYVVPAVGHIFALDTVKGKGGWDYPVFETKWIPSFEKKGSEFSKRYYKNIEDIFSKHNSARVIVATDYDTEGSVIGYNVLKFIGLRDDAERMKFSTLTKEDLVNSYRNRSDGLDFGQIESGLTRHYLDFYWGINMTRALTLAIKASEYKGFTLLSTGRIQGPTMNMLMEKEETIKKFKAKPFWKIDARVKIGDNVFVASYEEEKIWEKETADKVHESCKNAGKAKVTDISKRSYKQRPPAPFSTTDIQSESYAHFKYSPKQTLSVMESLYQSGAISYPRTSSQKLPPSIDYKKIMKAISKIKGYSTVTTKFLKKRLVPNEGMKKDPAHPAIYPTSETPNVSKLSMHQKRIYDLIVRRFLAVFSDDAERESMNVKLDINGNTFVLSGKTTITPGWTNVYGKYTRFDEQKIPRMKKGEEIDVNSIDVSEKKTQPPARFTQGSILKEMEKKGLGTKATRAEILQTLYNRKYISGKSITVTKLGETVTKVLKEFCPSILSDEMTKKFEKEMEDVYDSKKKREQVLEEAKVILKDVLSEFRKKEKDIGNKLLEGLTESRKDEYSMGKCPNCDSNLRLIVSKKTKKRFVGCSNYPECKTAFPLPQKGYITKLKTPCKDCGMQVVSIKRFRRRPYKMCINHECKSKEDWGKK